MKFKGRFTELCPKKNPLHFESSQWDFLYEMELNAVLLCEKKCIYLLNLMSGLDLDRKWQG